jgi:hypothetical protein
MKISTTNIIIIVLIMVVKRKKFRHHFQDSLPTNQLPVNNYTGTLPVDDDNDSGGGGGDDDDDDDNTTTLRFHPTTDVRQDTQLGTSVCVVHHVLN